MSDEAISPQEQIAATWAVSKAVAAALGERGIVADESEVAVVTVVIRKGVAFAVAIEPRPATLGQADAMAEAVNSLWAGIGERRRRIEREHAAGITEPPPEMPT